jgi:hypothetical protein
MIPLALEAWPAVFAGFIPILGLAGIGYVIVRAVRNADDEDDDEQPGPT